MLKLRSENQHDEGEISKLIRLAFENDPISDKREAQIVEELRRDRALVVSLVAEKEGAIVGHIAFSTVSIDGTACDWYGLAPVSVLPRYQNQGIGSQLVKEGLRQLEHLGAAGCVLLGEPGFYQRFGFEPLADLVLEGVPPEYFQALPLRKTMPKGTVRYHRAFG